MANLKMCSKNVMTRRPSGVHCPEANDLQVQQGRKTDHLRHPDGGVHGEEAPLHQGRSLRRCQRCPRRCRLYHALRFVRK